MRTARRASKAEIGTSLPELFGPFSSLLPWLSYPYPYPSYLVSL